MPPKWGTAFRRSCGTIVLAQFVQSDKSDTPADCPEAVPRTVTSKSKEWFMVLQLEASPNVSDRGLADRELENRVNNLIQHHISSVRTIEISARNGVITLRGRVKSFYNKQVCIHCCQRVAGVFQVLDRLEVVAGSRGNLSME